MPARAHVSMTCRVTTFERWLAHIPFFAAHILLLVATGDSFADDVRDAANADGGESVSPIAIAEVKRDGAVSYAREVRPILVRNCLACHNATKSESGLNLERPETMAAGGDSGPAIMPGRGVESLLVKVASHAEDPHMPPPGNKVDAKALTSSELGLIARWIDEGAKSDTSESTVARQWQKLPAIVHPIYSVAVSPDDQLVACGRGNQIQIYHLSTGKLISQLSDPALENSGFLGTSGISHLDLVQSLAFSPDGDLLASGGFREVKLWRRPRNVRAANISLPGGATAFAISPSGAWSAAGYSNGEIRRWDWGQGAEAPVIVGHSGDITALRPSADGARLVSTSRDRSLRVWNLADGRPIGQVTLPTTPLAAELIGDGELVAIGCDDHSIQIARLPAPLAAWHDVNSDPRGFAISSDRRVVSAADSNGTIRMLDSANGNITAKLSGRGVAVTSISMNANGNRLVAAEADGALRVWNTSEQRVIAELRPAAAPVAAVAMDPSGNRIFEAMADGAVRIMKVDAVTPTPIGPEFDATLQVAAVSATGRIAYAAAYEGRQCVVVAEMTSGAVVCRVQNLPADVAAVALDADGQMLAIAAAGQPIKVVRVADGAEIQSLPVHFPGDEQARSRALAFAAGGQTLYSAVGRQIQRWSIATGSQVKTMDFVSAISSIGVSRDNNRVAVGLTDGMLKVLGGNDGEEQIGLSLGDAPVQAISFSNDGSRVAALSGKLATVVELAGKRVGEVVDVEFGGGVIAFASPNELIAAAADRKLYKREMRLEHLTPPHGARAVQLLARPDGQAVFVLLADGQLHGLATNSGQSLFSFRHGSAANSMAMSPDGHWLATAGDDRQIRIWSADNGSPAPRPTLGGMSQTVTAIAYSGDGQKLVATAPNSNEVLTFDLVRGELQECCVLALTGPVTKVAAVDSAIGFILVASDATIRAYSPSILSSLAGHTQPVTSIAIHPQNKDQLVSASLDGTIRVWSLSGRQQIRQWDHGGPVSGLAVRRDGRQLASIGGHSLLKLWNLENGQPWTTAGGQPIPELKGDLDAQLRLAKAERGLSLANAKLADRKKSLQEAESAVTSSAEAVKTATSNRDNAAKTLAEKSEASKAPIEAKKNAELAVTKADESQKQAAALLSPAKEAAEKEPQNADLAKALADAQRAVEEATKQLNETQAKAKEAVAAAKKAEQEQVAAEAAAMAAEQALAVAVAASERAAAAPPQAQESVKHAETQLSNAQAAVEAAKVAAATLEKPMRAIAYSSDGSQIGTSGENQRIRVWNAENGLPIDTFVGHQSQPFAMAFLPNNRLLSAGGDGVILWETAPAWRLERTIGKESNAVTFSDRVLSLAFSPNGDLLATGSGDPSRSGEVKLWRVASGELAQALSDPHSDAVLALNFSPEGDFLASTGADRFMKVFRLSDGSLHRSYEGHTHHVLGVGWRADGKTLASCGADGVVKVWDVVSGDQKLTTSALSKELTSIAFVADSPRVLVTAGDKTVRVYNTENGGNERTFSGAADFVHQGAVTPDGKIVAAGSQDGKLLIWNVENGQVIQQFDAPSGDK